MPGRAKLLAAAPFRDDPIHLSALVKAEEVDLQFVRNGAEFRTALDGEPDVILLTQEALAPEMIDELLAHTRHQPAWSDVPVIIMTDTQPATLDYLKSLQGQLSDRSLTILHRPVRRGELLSCLRFALSARQRQLQLRDHLEFQEQLKRELSHRVKNILANVSALFFMTKANATSLDEFAQAFSGRLDALARAHGLLVTNEWTHTDLRAVIDKVLAPYQDERGTRIVVTGPEQRLGPGSAVTVALAIHELATNASKYGALSGGGGRIELSWAPDPRGEDIVVRWTERGGPPVSPPTRAGFGSAFIRSVVERSLQGKVEMQWLPQGLTAELRMPKAALDRG